MSSLIIPRVTSAPANNGIQKTDLDLALQANKSEVYSEARDSTTEALANLAAHANGARTASWESKQVNDNFVTYNTTKANLHFRYLNKIGDTYYPKTNITATPNLSKEISDDIAFFARVSVLQAAAYGLKIKADDDQSAVMYVVKEGIVMTSIIRDVFSDTVEATGKEIEILADQDIFPYEQIEGMYEENAINRLVYGEIVKIFQEKYNLRAQINQDKISMSILSNEIKAENLGISLKLPDKSIDSARDKDKEALFLAKERARIAAEEANRN